MTVSKGTSNSAYKRLQPDSAGNPHLGVPGAGDTPPRSRRGWLMLVFVIVVLLPVVALSTCRRGPVTTPRTLTSGRTIAVQSISRMNFPESGPALIFRYQTKLSLDDHAAVEGEVREIWADFEAEADKAKVDGVAIALNEKPKGWPIYHNRGFTIIYRRDSGGRWTMLPPKW